MLSYSNTDCLNNPITDLAPVSFKGKLSDNNCATFNGSSDGIFLSQSSIIDTDNCVISFDFRMPTSISHNIVFFQGIVKNDNDFSSGTAYGWHLYMVSGTKVINLCRPDGKKQNLGTHTELLDNKPHRFELTINGPSSPASLKIDNVSVITGSDSNSFKDTGRSYVGVGNESGSTLMDHYVGSIWNFKISDQNDNLIHWYPLAEGADTIAYDAIGSVNGEIVSTSITTFWNTKQDVFAYNAINGFGTISGSDAKVPLNLEGITYIKEYPNIDNGITPCESTIDFSQGVSNVAELNVIDPAIKIKAPDLIQNNFGADVGDGWTVGTVTETVSVGDWRAQYSTNTSQGVNYIKNTNLNDYDISEGINYAVDISSKGNPGATFIDNNLSYRKINYSNLANKNVWINLTIRIKPYQSILDNPTYWEQINGTGPGSDHWLDPNYGPIFGVGLRYSSIPLYFPDGTPAYVSSSNYRVAFKRLFNYNCEYGSYQGVNKWITLHYNGPYLVTNGSVYLGFGTGTSLITTEGACAIADINLQILPLGTYNKVTDNGSISNLLLYKTPQTGTNLTRIQNHVDNY